MRVEAAGCLVGCACCRYVLGRVDSAWKMYPVGFLFGLGFDTASEVGLLALAALGGAGAADGCHVAWRSRWISPTASSNVPTACEERHG